MIVIGRPINGVTLNGLEYILDDNSEIMKFETVYQALKFITKSTGFDDKLKEIKNEGIQFIYTNERRKCDCSRCERIHDCYMRGKLQRLPPEKSNGLGLSLCPKLKEEWTKQWT